MNEPARPVSNPAEPGIGTENERSLHSSIRQWYALPGDRFEVTVDGFVIDIVRCDLLVEIQTANFAAIARKLRSLVGKHGVLLVYAIPKEKWIVKVAPSDGQVVSRRKSPKRGALIDLFDELVSIPELIRKRNFSLEVLMITTDEIRCDDGKGSWWRKGVSIQDRRLIDVLESVPFRRPCDFLRFIPPDIEQPFTNRDLAEHAGISIRAAQRMTYCLRKMGAIGEVGRSGRALLFDVITSGRSARARRRHNEA